MNQLGITEFKNIRVLTSQQMADSYETDTKVISNNFNRNKERYEQGKHYICLEGEGKREFINLHQFDDSSIKATKIYLWTEKGAFLHAKSLNTDKAWEVYDRLVDEYFKVQEQKPHCIEDILIESLQEMKAVKDHLETQDKEIAAVQGRVESIREVVALDTTSWREETGLILKKIGNSLGGGQSYSLARSESYELLGKRMGVSLNTRLTNKRRRMAEEGVCKSKRDKLSYVDIIAEDKKLIEGYMAIVKEMAVRYGVA